MKVRNRVQIIGLALASLLVSSFILSGCVDGPKLAQQRKQIETQAEQIENRAYRCAPRELALAERHAEFGGEELFVGNGYRGEDHVLYADKMVKEADNKSLDPVCLQDGADRDKDGIFDAKDKCPDVPGLKEFDGCPHPDTDGDRVCDIWVSEQGMIGKFDCQGMDQCPDTPGELAYSGCSNPDKDGDGICDPWVSRLGFQEKFPACEGSDACPEVHGLKEYQGCPKPDSDGDGVCDAWVSEKNMMGKFECQGSDKCPFERGKIENNGCPEERKYIVVKDDRIELKEQFFFATNKTQVLKKSVPLLDEIATVLNENPTIHISVEGHTDSTGRYKSNVKLSKGRAASVVKELRKRGVDKGRMISDGFGPDRPIDTNDTPEGRANNRRVEIRITKR